MKITKLKKSRFNTKTNSEPPNHQQSHTERPWIEDVWVRVYDRTDKEGVGIPPGADFVVVGRLADSLDCSVTTILEKAVKTFPQVEQLVTELKETHRYADSFTLQGNDPRIVQLATKLGLVKLPENQDKGAA